jgi:hypothetical protein
MIGHLFPWFYRRKALPGPGSNNIAFETLALPEFTPIGPGIANHHQFQLLTRPTLAPHMIGVQGLGGLQHGQVYGTRLINTQTGG